MEIYGKSSMFDVWQVSNYASEQTLINLFLKALFLSPFEKIGKPEESQRFRNVFRMVNKEVFKTISEVMQSTVKKKLERRYFYQWN